MIITELSLPGVDVTMLLAPINPASPAGLDLRKLPRSVYLEIENLIEGKAVPEMITVDATGRQTTIRDDRALARSIGDGLKRALNSLTKESKDLEIAALCARALLSVHGYEGLWCGLYLMRMLHEQFWELLYPNPPAYVQTLDEFDEPLAQPIYEFSQLTERRMLSARAGAVEKMAHYVREALKLTPLFVGDDGLPCRVADWEAAKVPDPERTVDQLNTLASSQPAELFLHLEEIVDGCIEECRQLGEVLEEKYTRPADKDLKLAEFEAPSVGSLVSELRDCLVFLSDLSGRFGKKAAAAGKKTALSGRPSGDVRAVAPAPVASVGTYQPKDRAEALSMLLAAGQFLQRHEPLSPLPRLLFRLVQWARGDSLRPFLEDMFRTSENEAETIFMNLGLETEGKLAGERLPAGCPSPKDRADALAMLTDVAAKLQAYEPLSPLPYHLNQLLALTAGGSPRQWLAHVFSAESSTLVRIYRLLGLASEAPAESPAAEN